MTTEKKPLFIQITGCTPIRHCLWYYPYIGDTLEVLHEGYRFYTVKDKFNQHQRVLKTDCRIVEGREDSGDQVFLCPCCERPWDTAKFNACECGAQLSGSKTPAAVKEAFDIAHGSYQAAPVPPETPATLSQTEILEGEVLLAEYMGYIRDDNRFPSPRWLFNNFWYNAELLMFDASYDWQHEVWHKFRDERVNTSDLGTAVMYAQHSSRISQALIRGKTPLDVFIPLVEGIKWINSIRKA